MKVEDIRRFEKEDWYGYAGAEQFSDGTDPFICKGVLNEGSVEIVIVADARSIGIELTGEGTKDVSVWLKEKGMTAMQAEGELRHLIKYLDQYSYAPDLSYVLDHPDDITVEGFKFLGEC